MKFEKGVSGNPNGRPKGASNKVNAALRDMISAFLEKNFSTVEKEFQQLEGKDKIKAYIDLMPYVMPKMQSISTDFDLENLTNEQLDEIIERLTQKANVGQ